MPFHEARRNSATGTRTRVARVRAEYPNQLDYSGFWWGNKISYDGVKLRRCWRLARHAPLAPTKLFLPPDMCGLSAFRAAIAQLGERQTEDLKVPGSIPGLGICARHKILEPASCWHFIRKLGSKTV